MYQPPAVCAYSPPLTTPSIVGVWYCAVAAAAARRKMDETNRRRTSVLGITDLSRTGDSEKDTSRGGPGSCNEFVRRRDRRHAQGPRLATEFASKFCRERLTHWPLPPSRTPRWRRFLRGLLGGRHAAAAQ